VECGPQDHIWLASSRGLLQWLPESERFQPVPGAPATAIHALHVGRDGQVWLSEDGRLSRYRWSQGRLERQAVVGAEQGYPAISASGLVVDRAWPGRPAHAAWCVSVPMGRACACMACTTACPARNSASTP
jgi:ligand-binding sensor domain-containing protein